VSNELSNYCCANGQSRLDDPGSFGAPGLWIDDHLACFTPKMSLVRTQCRPPVRPACTSRFGHGGAAGCDDDERGSVGGRRSAPDVNQLCRAWDQALVMRELRIVVTRGPSGSGQARALRAMCTQSDLLAGTNLGHEWQSDGRIGDGFHLPEPSSIPGSAPPDRRSMAALVQ
jgi:hypothetical protein